MGNLPFNEFTATKKKGFVCPFADFVSGPFACLLCLLVVNAADKLLPNE